ncbi:SCO2400 family protein [Streptomyces sp.]|uniref:SCO2400 family protein n=1 Tax=Streptomyces sp. TaxID=1931 RepID=UPI002F418088
MDYCFSCRRTLNGALVCPGCGAYAPDIAPPATRHESGGTAGISTMAWDPHRPEHTASPDPYAPWDSADHSFDFPSLDGMGHHRTEPHPWDDVDPLAEFAALDEASRSAERAPWDRADHHHSDFAAPGGSTGYLDLEPVSGIGRPAGGPVDGTGPSGELVQRDHSDNREIVPLVAASGAASVLDSEDIAPTLHSGRAGRRRQMERWRKNRRRAAAATAVALFGGGLTVAAMPSHSSKVNSATAPLDDPLLPSSLHTDNAAVAQPDAQAPAHSRTDTAPHHSTTVTPHRTAAAHPAQAVTHAAAPAAAVAKAPSSPVVRAAGPVIQTGIQSPQTTTVTSVTQPQQAAPQPATNPTPAPEAQPSTTPQQPSTSPTSTPPPPELCLLVLCLG